MKYSKPALTLDQQVELLVSRGILGDPAVMRAKLEVVNYHRLSAYWHTFRGVDGNFLPMTRFDVVWGRYVFDRELRLLVTDALERVEIAVRAGLAYHHAQEGGPFGYATSADALYAHDPKRRAEFLQRIRDDVARSHEPAVEHYRRNHAEHPDLPVWVAAEIVTFGGILSWYRGSPRSIRRAVADRFGVADVVLDSWLLSLNTVRNLCAHHGRLWNREVALRPKLPRTPEWTTPVVVGNDRLFGVLTILTAALGAIAPGTTWPARLVALLDAHPEVPRAHMGFPPGWEACPVWASALQAPTDAVTATS